MLKAVKLNIILLLVYAGGATFAQSVSIDLAQQYYAQGDLEKALDVYSKLAKNSANWQLIHNPYFTLLIQLEEFQKANKYINKIIKSYPRNPNYKIDKGKLVLAENARLSSRQGEEKANQYYTAIRNEFSDDPYYSRRAAQYFLQIGEREQAVSLLLLARKKSGDETLFALDLANIYRYMNKKQDMVEQYIIFANVNKGNLRYVKNSLQVTLTKPEDIENLESFLFKKIQEEPGNTVYTELLIWANLQTKNFTSAFIQARALDRRMSQGGVALMDIGKMALSNKDYKTADKVFGYLVQTYAGSNISVQAELWQISTKEEEVKSTYPVSKESLLQLTELYIKFITQYPTNPLAYKANLQMALVQGYYLNEKSEAIQSLQKLIENPRVNSQLKSEAKLTLADIYLLNEEPWESTLLYAQVDKTMKETPIGYRAKLKRAKLAYYQGEFELAQAILDILKLATSREIANDALDLSIFIKENTVFDSTHQALKTYASIELLLYQHKNEEVLANIDTVINYFKGQSIEDNFILLKATELKKNGSFMEAANSYGQIVTKFPVGVLADKALFLQADIFQNYLQQPDKAQELYVRLLKEYPGSIYVAEARKQFRILRGDFEPSS
ncbi:MAG: tetratricopeptide repeat protein [Cyclobacteriaceae bacterium]|nr:tetratricopeptide repeat protein [Cyclobacteriaceae bacterium]